MGTIVKQLIEQADRLKKAFTNDDQSVDKEAKESVVRQIHARIEHGQIGSIEGVILLSAMDGLEQEGLPIDAIRNGLISYPQFKRVERAKSEIAMHLAVPCELEYVVGNCFIHSYCVRSIDFDELAFRLVILGLVPNSMYLRAKPKDKRVRGVIFHTTKLW